ncbi:hypothetical protein HK097_006762, partial [Rhizophlyctis rosea]
VWHYLFRFAIQSNLLYSASLTFHHTSQTTTSSSTSSTSSPTSPFPPHILQSAKPTQDFLDSINDFIHLLTQLLSLTHPPHLIATQTLILQHFPSLIPELSRILPPEDIIVIVEKVVNSVRKGVSGVQSGRVNCIRGVMRSDLLRDRGEVLERVVEWCGEALNGEWEDGMGFMSVGAGTGGKGREYMRLCLDVLAEGVEGFSRISEVDGNQGVEGALVRLLVPLSGVYAEVWEALNASTGDSRRVSSSASSDGGGIVPVGGHGIEVGEVGVLVQAVLGVVSESALSAYLQQLVEDGDWERVGDLNWVVESLGRGEYLDE